MTFWIIQSTIISIVLIFLVHYLFIFFRDTLTVPKIKDLVNKPKKKYDEILSTVQTTKKKIDKNSNKKSDVITSETKVNMKNQLHSFLNDLKKKNNAGQPVEFSLYK
jgi:ABC-type Na+ efflux pump permease subunit